MANDKMRTGPRGSSDQAALVGPLVIPFVQDDGATTPGAPWFTKDVAADDGILGGVAMGCEYRPIKIFLKVFDAFETNDIELDIGLAASPDGLVDGFVSGSATTPAGAEIEIPLNGTLAATLNFGATSGPLLLTSGTSAGDGIFGVYVLAEPVSGPLFTNA